MSKTIRRNPAALIGSVEEMEIDALARRAHEVRERFGLFELEQYGERWSIDDLVLGLMKDVGDLAAAVQRVEGKRPQGSIEPLAELRHELADCLWVLLVLARRYEIELEAAFIETMDDLDEWLDSQSDQGND